MKSFDKKSISLKTYLWLYFCSFAVMIMLILWILQILFMSTFFKSMKLSELKKFGLQIKTEYNNNVDNFDEYWLKNATNRGAFAHLINEDGEIVRNSDVLPEHSNYKTVSPPNRDHRRFVDEIFFKGFLKKIEDSGSDNVSYIEKSDRMDALFAIYGSYLGNRNGKKIYLFLSSPLERTDTTRMVLQTQLIIVTVLSVILALILAYFIAKRFSKPIEKNTYGAHSLAVGNYDVKFEHGSYREINELADALNFTADELAKTEMLRRDLIANVSHDIRTPLTIIKSYAEMIRDISGDNKEKRNRHTGVIIDETNRLSNLVSDMLDLSKMQSGTVKTKFDRFNISETTGYIIRCFEFYKEENGFIFNENIQNDMYVLGDKSQIERVIYNLIANAINHADKDKNIDINVYENKENVFVSIKDNGSGISKSEINRVWDRYYSSSNTHTRQTLGTGIGLSIVKSILDAHNARFGVNSDGIYGSEFWFELDKALN